MKKFALLAFVSFFLNTAHAQKDSSGIHARQLLELTGAGKGGIQMMNNMIASFKTTFTAVPVEFWDEFMKEANPAEMVDLLVPIYIKYYTDAELMQLLAFYKSPIGQKVIEQLPLISQDSYKVGEEWGRKIGEKVAERLKDKGYLKKD
jgi:uncharacterized protein